MPSTDRVKIFDTTLRDGEQSPGATMTHEEKLEIASLLDEMGVDIIEAGFPIASEGDFRAVSEIARATRERRGLRPRPRQPQGHRPLLGGGAHAARPRIHTFIGTSPLHRAIPNLDQDQMAERIHETVTHARNLCEGRAVVAMDATRTEPDYLCRVVEIAIKAGATTINIPDTVGYTYPRESATIIRMLLERVPGADDVTFATHCHNDLGPWRRRTRWRGGRLARRQIECTINGLGRAGGQHRARGGRHGHEGAPRRAALPHRASTPPRS
jgi:2-isopropylmalate synthase